MQRGVKRPLIVIYGSYGIGIRGNCRDELENIVNVGKADMRLAWFEKSTVKNLDFHIPPPSEDSPDYKDWVMEKSNHYLQTADFNAIFILQGCDNSTPLQEAQFVLEHGLESKSIIFFEMSEDDGENSACSLYTQATWRNKYENVPIEYIEYKDFKSAWRKIMGKFLG